MSGVSFCQRSLGWCQSCPGWGSKGSLKLGSGGEEWVRAGNMGRRGQILVVP